MVVVSIHAPREGCDSVHLASPISYAWFQFTHPGRGATCSALSNCYTKSVSIHAPREGCDLKALVLKLWLPRFNSRTPGGVRLPRGANDRYEQLGFNSRTPGGVRLLHALVTAGSKTVSIHAPREGCDRHTFVVQALTLGFNSRTPGGVRPRGKGLTSQQTAVSIHAPREGCDYY